jgi:hypothetical protein
VDGRDVRVIERRQELRFAAQSGKRFGVSEDAAGENLDCDLASEPRIPGAIHLSHAAGPERGKNLVRAKKRADCEGHAG